MYQWRIYDESTACVYTISGAFRNGSYVSCSRYFMRIFKQSTVLSLVFLYVILIGAMHVYIRKVSRVEWEYRQGNSNVFIGETNMCKMKISNKSIFPIFNIVFRFKCENKLIWNHDEINKIRIQVQIII